jgi:hypothetical protein
MKTLQETIDSYVNSASAGPAVQTVNGEQVSSSPRTIDPDTIAIGNKRYRPEGFNAPETAKLQGGLLIPSQELVPLQPYVDRFAKEGEYTNLVTGGKDLHGRTLARQENPNVKGSSLGDDLTMAGVAPINLYSSDQAVRQENLVRAYASMFPSLAAEDPLLRIGQEFKQAQETARGNKPLYVAGSFALDEDQYAAVNNAVGTQAAKREIEEIARLERILAEEDLRPSKREELHKELEDARNRLYLAATSPAKVSGVMNRRTDRNMMNEANNQFGASLHRAVLDMYKNFGGILQLAGDETEWDYLSEKGFEVVTRNKYLQGDIAATLSSYKDINTNDPWSAITDTATYVTNLFAGTIPHLALLLTTTALTGGAATPLALTLSSAPSALIYAGGIYAEQEEKNAELALMTGFGAGVLDRIALQALIPGGGNALFTLVGRKAIAEQLVKEGRAESIAAANRILEQATKQELIDMSKAGAKFASQQYATSQSILRSAGMVGFKGASEGVTETIQSAAELIGSYGQWNLDAQYERDFYENLVNSAVGGTALGASMGMSGEMIDAMQWHSASNALQNFQKNLLDTQAFMNDQLSRASVSSSSSAPAVTSVLEAARYANGLADPKVTSIQDLPANEGAWNGFKAVVMDPIRLFRSLVNTAVPSITKDDGSFKYNLAYLKSIMGGQGILPGLGYAGTIQKLIGGWASKVPTPEDVAANLNTNVKNAENRIRDAWLNYWSKGERLPDTPENAVLQSWKDDLDSMKESIRQEANSVGVPVDDLISDNALFEAAPISPREYPSQKERVIQAMVNAGAKRRLAAQAAEDVMSGNVPKASAARRFMGTYGVFSNPDLADIFEQNLFHSMENLKQDVAHRIASQTLIGEGGRNLAHLLKRAWDAGEFRNEQEYMDTVKNVRDWYDIINGRYNTLDNYPFVNKLVGWGTTLTMLASLGKAAMSSIPEVAISTLGTNGDKVKDQLAVAVSSFFREYKADINKAASWSTAKVGLDIARATAHSNLTKKINALTKEFEELQASNASPEKLQALAAKIERLHKEDLGRSLFERLGYNETGYNTQSRFELAETNQRKTMQVFAALIGLRAMTDSVRVAALTVASDIVVSKITNLQTIPQEQRAYALATGKGLSISQAEDLQELQNFGMNVPQVLSALDYLNGAQLPFDKATLVESNFEEGQIGKVIQDNILNTLINMVDNKVVNPQGHNLPKYYHDPRFRILTVMTRFIAALHANILPRLYRDFIVRGNVGMRYQAFAVIGMALAFAHVANLLKDEIAYEEGINPFIQEADKQAQRALYGSGLLARFEGFADAINPLYPFRKPDPSQDPAAYAYSVVKDQSPVINWADRLVRGMYQVGAGETEQGVRNLARSAPFIGSFPVATQDVARQFKEE